MQGSIPFFDISVFSTIRIIFRYGINNYLSKECSHEWQLFNTAFLYESKNKLDNCHNSCLKTKEELGESLKELVDCIGNSFDFSLLNQYRPLAEFFCSFPDLIGEISCDASLVAVSRRFNLFIKEKVNPIGSEIKLLGKESLLEDLKLFLVSWLFSYGQTFKG